MTSAALVVLAWDQFVSAWLTKITVSHKNWSLCSNRSNYQANWTPWCEHKLSFSLSNLKKKKKKTFDADLNTHTVGLNTANEFALNQHLTTTTFMFTFGILWRATMKGVLQAAQKMCGCRAAGCWLLKQSHSASYWWPPQSARAVDASPHNVVKWISSEQLKKNHFDHLWAWSVCKKKKVKTDFLLSVVQFLFGILLSLVAWNNREDVKMERGCGEEL